MSVIPQTPRASGAPALDPLGTLSGSQIPLLLTPPLIPNPGSAPGIGSYMGTQVGPIIFIQDQSVYVLTVYCYVINRKASNTNLSFINLCDPNWVLNQRSTTSESNTRTITLPMQLIRGWI